MEILVKTPTLLDISKSAPYFHNGSVATLEEAVDVMLSGGKENPHLDTVNLQPVTLTDAEQADLLAFLRSLRCQLNHPGADPALMARAMVWERIASLPFRATPVAHEGAYGTSGLTSRCAPQ